MTIREAVEILNRENHNGASDWMLSSFPGGQRMIMSPSVTMRLSGMTDFEAVAVAQRYEREKPAEPEKPRSKAAEVASRICGETVGKGRMVFTEEDFSKLLNGHSTEKKGTEGDKEPL